MARRENEALPLPSSQSCHRQLHSEYRYGRSVGFNFHLPVVPQAPHPRRAAAARLAEVWGVFLTCQSPCRHDVPEELLHLLARRGDRPRLQQGGGGHTWSHGQTRSHTASPKRCFIHLLTMRWDRTCSGEQGVEGTGRGHT